jgi:hypothetical protein
VVIAGRRGMPVIETLPAQPGLVQYGHPVISTSLDSIAILNLGTRRSVYEARRPIGSRSLRRT